MLRKIVLAVALVLTFLANSAWAADTSGFPGRSLYREIPIIEMEDLHRRYDEVLIVDVRSHYEYETLHIKGALNHPVADIDFIKKIEALRAGDPKPIMFYCNGRTCMKSYQAAKRARHAGIDEVYAYDAGIMEWTRAFPDKSVLLGRTPVNPASLISDEQLKARLLAPEDFAKQVKQSNTIVLDIRDAFQRASFPMFASKRESVALDNKELKVHVDRAKSENKTLLIYDEVGKQIRWLQYFLEHEGVNTYYFMEGGANGFYDALVMDGP